MLVTVVFGVVSGVGIWFTIGLISPMATSNLIHAYVWGWAIEWVFFFVEITAALLYLYGWEKLEPALHEWYGWIYFIAAFASMVIINGIITFMLTSGTWVQNHQFWSGFFNPTYFPSLVFRFAIALALAGVYALITASVQKDVALKARIVRWSALWIVPSLVVLPGSGLVVYPPDSRRNLGQRSWVHADWHIFCDIRRGSARHDARADRFHAGPAGADALDLQPVGWAGRAWRNGVIRICA